MNLSPILTPHGRLLLAETEDAPALPDGLAQRLQLSFKRGHGHGLLQLGAGEVNTVLPPAFGYWRDFASRYITAICTLPRLEERGFKNDVPDVPALSAGELETLVASAPPMIGAEYLTSSVLQSLWDDIEDAFRTEVIEFGRPVQEFLKSRSPAWNLVGRVHFNLAENRKDDEAPFAFLATYTTRLSAHAKAQHVPLGQALREYAGPANKGKLLSLLLPVQRAAEKCAWLRAMVDSGEIYHPLRWTAAEAFQLLKDLSLLESAGVIVRVPGGWTGQRPPRPKVTATVGAKNPSGIGADALLDFRIEVTLDGEPLTDHEIATLLSQSDGLYFLKGRWIELDREKLGPVLDQFRTVERTASESGLSFAEAMRLIAGANVSEDTDADTDRSWSRVVPGPWLTKMLQGLRTPSGLGQLDPGTALKTTLRPYQQVGLRWLHFASIVGLGSCLADDMGLGKTMQVLALMLVRCTRSDNERRTDLIVAPASLLANWASEIARFAPKLNALIAHPSVLPAANLREMNEKTLSDTDVVITSYGSLLRIPALTQIPWRLVILDEAQAIKNSAAQQTRAAKQLNGQARIALTGTPIENRLGDLWSIFDFLNPGLLGSAREFTILTKRLANRPHNSYAPLRELVRPYILRRLKTDKTVISDLPDKIEATAYCHLSRTQAALYQEAVKELGVKLKSEDLETDSVRRKGIVLSFLMRFKQICNHPCQWLGSGSWAESDSGKFQRLREIVDTIRTRQEKILVFTQFREITEPLADFLTSVFGKEGLVLHGQTDVKRRRTLVDRFQEDDRVPFFVLSLKAGGTGLNLTAASHVIHFDRWWNPAVENQATDRAFRIGQMKNVLVHKFLCRGTVEEKIDALIESKRQLSKDLLEGGAELLLTEMSDEELMKLVALDLHAVSEE